MPPKLGNVNGFVKSIGWVGLKAFEFDGTTKGLVKSAIANGAKAGDIVSANFGGQSRVGARKLEIYSAPWDDRAGGFWAK